MFVKASSSGASGIGLRDVLRGRGLIRAGCIIECLLKTSNTGPGHRSEVARMLFGLDRTYLYRKLYKSLNKQQIEMNEHGRRKSQGKPRHSVTFIVIPLRGVITETVTKY